MLRRPNDYNPRPGRLAGRRKCHCLRLPIGDPDTLFAAAASDSILCLDVAQAILNDPSGNTAAEICAPILANAPASTATATPPRASATSSTSTSTATSNALPPSWPPTSFFTGEGKCLACRPSQYLVTVKPTATAAIQTTRTKTPTPA
jgi:hypothetical protein